MAEYRLKTGKIGEKVTSAYQKIEDGVVKTYKKVEDAFVDRFLEKVEEEDSDKQHFTNEEGGSEHEEK